MQSTYYATTGFSSKMSYLTIALFEKKLTCEANYLLLLIIYLPLGIWPREPLKPTEAIILICYQNLPRENLATPNFICYITDDNSLQHSGCRSSKQPVPLPTTRPTTSLDDGEANFSVSPDSTAPRRKCVVVSKLIF